MADENDTSERLPSRAARRREQAASLRRLQTSLREIALLLDTIEGRPHPLLRASAERLVPPRAKGRVDAAKGRVEAAKSRAESLARYTEHFATTLAKAHISLKE